MPSTGNDRAIPRDEKQAFEFFFRQYYAALCFFAHAIIHDEDEAKDLVQECFVTLWNSHTIIERAETVQSFLYTAVRNRCLSYLRKKKLIKKVELKLIKAGENEDFEYFDEVAFAEMIRQVMGHIDDLPTRMQKVVQLYFLEGKKFKQIAAELHSTKGAVRKQKDRALDIIRKKFLLLRAFFTPAQAKSVGIGVARR